MAESCPRTVELSAYIDDELRPAARAQLQAHLACCVHCSRMLAGLQTVHDDLHALPDERLGTDLAAVIGNRIGTLARPRAPRPLRQRLLQLVPIGLGAGAALSLGLVMGAGLMAGAGSLATPRIAALAVFAADAPGNLCAGTRGCLTQLDLPRGATR